MNKILKTIAIYLLALIGLFLLIMAEEGILVNIGAIITGGFAGLGANSLIE